MTMVKSLNRLIFGKDLCRIVEDFITSADRNKKNRPNLTKDIPNETKPSTRQPPRKRKDKLVTTSSLNFGSILVFFLKIDR